MQFRQRRQARQGDDDYYEDGLHSSAENTTKQYPKNTDAPFEVLEGGVDVGVAGFEPATLCSQSRCANRAALHPDPVKGLQRFEEITESQNQKKVSVGY